MIERVGESGTNGKIDIDQTGLARAAFDAEVVPCLLERSLAEGLLVLDF